jgi:hypothetical protein
LNILRSGSPIFRDWCELVTIRHHSRKLFHEFPQNEFVLKQFSAKDGIELDFHGEVKDVRLGAGPSDLRSAMPSLFDQAGRQVANEMFRAQMRAPNSGSCRK